jgi:pimeloyl-ACP methyl ester carboxylesterase/DNA-binding CsgD family transcriptional regulator
MAHLWRFAPEWMQGLAARFQVVQHDMWGFGGSDRGLPPDVPEHFDQDTVDAIIDRLRIDRFIALGLSGVGHVAVRYAAGHPERIEALILIGTTVTSGMPSFFRGVAAENWEFFLRSFVPPSAGPEVAQRWFESLCESTTHDDWQVVARMATESNLEEDLQRLRVPTLVLHSREMAMSSPEGARRLASLVPGARLVMLEAAGLSGAGVASVLGDAAGGLAAIDAFFKDLPPRSPAPEVPAEDGGVLSAREIEVLRLLAAGRSNQQIADELVISLNTVRRHVSNIFDKTGVANRAEAATYAARNGLV